MKRILIYLLLILLGGCNEKTIQKPEDLISQEKMVEIIYDLAIINAAKKTNPDYLIRHKIEPMPFIYEKHGIDSLQFIRSDLYYASVPEVYEAMYKIVEARLEKEKSEYDLNKTRVSDSIRLEAEKQRERLRQEALRRQEKDSAP